MTRVFILVADSLGIGAAPDAEMFGDGGANTLGHIAKKRALAGGQLNAPHLEELGLGAAMFLASGEWPARWNKRTEFAAGYAAAAERSKGKDTPSGHWEMTGVPVDFEWGYFPNQPKCFPTELISTWVNENALPGVLGECHASGTQIIDALGQEHLHTQKPIVYTSADSVFQVAAHESIYPPDELYRLCQDAFSKVQKYRIARVIARPFVGQPGSFKRTSNRRDFAVLPPSKTLIDFASCHGYITVAIGKISDIFSGRSIDKSLKGKDNNELFDHLIDQVKHAENNSLVFVNFVDFDQNYGHRRDVEGYADAIEAFDKRLPAFINLLKAEDIAVLTADHGCDPTMPGTDHTREYVPQLYFGPAFPRTHIGNLGCRSSFSDLGQTLSKCMNLPRLSAGISVI